MKIGASSSCFYPMETEKAFEEICNMGFSCSEIFFNSRCELEKPFVREIKKIKDSYETEIVSIHPYASFSEGYDFFSKYERRFYDGVENYKRFFEAANTLGAEFIVMHGTKGRLDIEKEEYAERFFELNRVAKTFGVTVAHENVVTFAGEKPEFMKYMKEALKDDFKMVLDIKQARRARVNPLDFIGEMNESIIHVHVSDFSNQKDCIAPSEKGLFNFSELFTALKNVNYNGKYIIELYSDSFKDKIEIQKSGEYLKNILKSV